MTRYLIAALVLLGAAAHAGNWHWTLKSEARTNFEVSKGEAGKVILGLDIINEPLTADEARQLGEALLWAAGEVPCTKKGFVDSTLPCSVFEIPGHNPKLLTVNECADLWRYKKDWGTSCSGLEGGPK